MQSILAKFLENDDISGSSEVRNCVARRAIVCFLKESQNYLMMKMHVKIAAKCHCYHKVTTKKKVYISR